MEQNSTHLDTNTQKVHMDNEMKGMAASWRENVIGKILEFDKKNPFSFSRNCLPPLEHCQNINLHL
jgi:hypothetical protein